MINLVDLTEDFNNWQTIIWSMITGNEKIFSFIRMISKRFWQEHWKSKDWLISNQSSDQYHARSRLIILYKSLKLVFSSYLSSEYTPCNIDFRLFYSTLYSWRYTYSSPVFIIMIDSDIIQVHVVHQDSRSSVIIELRNRNIRVSISYIMKIWSHLVHRLIKNVTNPE